MEIASPEKFSFDATKWLAWKRFKRFRVASDLCNKAGESQVAILVFAMSEKQGPTGRKIFTGKYILGAHLVGGLGQSPSGVWRQSLLRDLRGEAFGKFSMMQIRNGANSCLK